MIRGWAAIKTKEISVVTILQNGENPPVGGEAIVVPALISVNSEGYLKI